MVYKLAAQSTSTVLHEIHVVTDAKRLMVKYFLVIKRNAAALIAGHVMPATKGTFASRKTTCDMDVIGSLSDGTTSTACGEHQCPSRRQDPR